jgi:diguanylate cyclase (GGDEF)-like protein
VFEGGAPQADIVLPNGQVVTCGLAVATPARTGMEGFVIQLRRAGGMGLLHEALAAMAEGQPLMEVLSHLRAMAETDLPYTRVAILRGWNGAHYDERLGGPPELDPRHAGQSAWIRERGAGVVVDVNELPPALREPAIAAGVTSCWVHAIEIEHPVEIHAAVLGWHVAPWRMTAFTEVALGRLSRLVRLALQWDSSRGALEWAASHDQLTGLDNRAAFFEKLRVAGASGEAAVLYIDLDRFKPVNDEHGHGVGDLVLSVVAERLARSVREGDTVARLGGDEFAVHCPALAPGGAEVLAERLIASVSMPISVEGLTVSVGVSVGIASGDARVSPDELVGRADNALREAKRSGRGRWRRG